MPQQTKIIVRDLKVITSRPNYTLHQVVAVKPDGSPIVDGMGQELNLRAFQELPKNRVIDVEVETFTSERYGTSYTLKAVNYSLTDRVEELEARVKVLEEKLANSTPAAAPPPPPPGAPPPPPPAAGQPAQDDIPF